MSDKNGPMGKPDLKPCPRQCTVWPNAIFLYDQFPFTLYRFPRDYCRKTKKQQ